MKWLRTIFIIVALMCIYSKIGITLYIDNPIIKLVKFEYPNTKAFNKWKVEMEHVYKRLNQHA